MTFGSSLNPYPVLLTGLVVVFGTAPLRATEIGLLDYRVRAGWNSLDLR